MARRLVWMPVLPRVTVSAALNLRESAGRTKGRVAKAAGWIQAAPAAQAVRWRNSRRFMGPPCCGDSGSILPLTGRAKLHGVIRRFARMNLEELRSRGIARPRPIYHLCPQAIQHAPRGR